MEDPNYYLGKTLKKIRENKGYTQQEISNSKMSRSNYTKLEQDEINPNVVKYLAILDHLDMRHEEFSFILNGYKLTPKEHIFYLYKKMEQKPDIDYVRTLIHSTKNLLTEREDHFTRDLYNIALGYEALLKEHSLKKACKHARKVWSRLEELDKFYLAEYHLLNGILYSFELETAISLTDKSIEGLKKYDCFKEADDLILSYLLKITCLLIANKKYKMALRYIDKLMKKSMDEYNILTTGAAFVRRGICLEYLEDSQKGLYNYNIATELFRIAHREDLIKETQESPKAVYNPYVYVEGQENKK